ncbi:hypothetical protein XELAEV_18037227mg [Xenopus laevis]|uniref:Uncharacterized protein n=1 Tax=Xenopus laevis TaxID=8355 RepID=A0A974CBT1_XENLA|nr:hypothetical protein XELAEV_18037227mg [Xenopus laevis]
MASGGGLKGTFLYSDTDIARIGNLFEGSEEFFATPSLTGCRRKYETQRKRCVELKLHGLTLTEYLQLQRIPRGLKKIKSLEMQLSTTENILKSSLQDEEFIQIKSKTEAMLEKF